MKKFLMFFILVFCMLSSIAFANFNYSEVGFNDYALGTGQFNADISGVSFSARNINSPQLIPLVVDLDQNGSNEIVVLDGQTFRLYHNSGLEIIDSVIVSTIGTEPHFVAYDIDNDGLTELIVASRTSQNISIVEYNGTDFYVQNTINLPLTDKNTGSVMVKCGATENCLIAFNEHDSSDFNALRDMKARAFNSTGFVTSAIVLKNHNGFGSANRGGNFCLPRIRNIEYEDYDNDGNSEYIFSYAYVTESVVDDKQAIINYVYNNGTDLINEKELLITADVFDTSSAFTCSGNTFDGLLTSPSVYDYDGASSNGLETIIGVMKDADEFKIYSYNSAGGDKTLYPAIEDADGIIVSNVFRANAFPDNDPDYTEYDFCVAGFQSTTDILDVTCGSLTTASGIKTREYTMTNTPYDVTDSYYNQNFISHSAKHSTTTSDGTNLDEVVNSYGVISLDWDSCNILGDCDATLIYENPKAEAVVLSVDVEKVNKEDLLIYTSTNLWYAEDGFSTSGAVINDYSINPCIDTTWKQNTTVSVAITPTDVDGDLVSARAILYYGKSYNKTSAWSVNGSSGTTFSFNFVANVTTGTDILRLEAKDISNPSDVNQIDLSISVGTDGVEFGECTTEFALDVTTISDDVELEAFRNNNSIVNTMDQVKGITNLNMSNTAFWLLIMVVIGAFMWQQHGHKDPAQTYAVLVSIEFIMLILGFYLGFIGMGVIFSIIVVSVGAIAFKVHNRMTGG